MYSWRNWSSRACRSVIVAGCSGWARSHFLRGQLEAFDLALGLGVVAAAVLLGDAEVGQGPLEGVLAATDPGGGVPD